jgi:hypothetical protein
MVAHVGFHYKDVPATFTLLSISCLVLQQTLLKVFWSERGEHGSQ